MNIENLKSNINQFVEEKKKEISKNIEAYNSKKKEPKKHIISILFITYKDFASRLVSLRSGLGYSHVSISIDEKNEFFYAFNTKGFRKEHPDRHLDKIKNCICYMIEVTTKQYNKLKKAIREIERSKKKYKYNWLGLYFCFVNLPLKMKRRYFCSQFVGKLLERAEIIKFNKSTSRYLPQQLSNEVKKSPKIVKVIENYFHREVVEGVC